jgi:tagatose-1,6-bisphosphate aldolase
VLVAAFGLAAFALVLALVEQVVLEANNRNVKRGSRVYETGHYLILGWGVSQRDLEMMVKVVQQVRSVVCGGVCGLAVWFGVVGCCAPCLKQHLNP